MSSTEPFVYKPYGIDTQTRSLVNSEILSDVTFLVGRKRRKVFGHKFPLSLGSPVFFAMLNGGLRSSGDQPIEVPDLEEEGFLNMLKYIYGHQLDESYLNALRSTYTACQKYLVHHFSDALASLVKNKLLVLNCCAFFEQLLQIEEEADSLDCVRKFIAINGKAVLRSNGFLKISQTTLIHILQIKHLNTPEVAVVKACFKWIDRQLKRQSSSPNLESRQEKFGQIRGYLRLSDIPAEEYSKINNLDSFLSRAELGDLFLTLFNNRQTDTFPCHTDRVQVNGGVASCQGSLAVQSVLPSEFRLKLKVSRFALIKTIHTFIVPSLCPPTIEIFENDVDLQLRYTPIPGGHRNLIIQFDEYFEVHSGRTYKLVFKSNSKDLLLYHTVAIGILEDSTNGPFKFTLSEFTAPHPIRKIEFCFPCENTLRN